ncbi:amino acid adenylation domain-containing protein [Streptomyces sp. NPDC059534]|uniref:amino acid adenylation domain-containing protein n=1 Tax=Streptomyces sp. NPDC059534 TaxID=3346859 RepID=UPI0036D1F348
MADTRTNGPSPERIAFERALLGRAVAERAAVRERPEVLPVSFGQQRMWLSEQMDSESSAETTVFVIGLRGELDLPALRGAVTDLTTRHEVLRTVIVPEGEGLAQRVLPAGEVPLPVVDIPAEGAEAAVEEFAQGRLRYKQDLAAEPPVDWTLLRSGGHSHHLVLRMHHCAADGWSEGVLNRDLSALYRARRTGEPDSLPPLPLQYADFALAQRAQLSEGGAERGLAHWRARLAGEVPPVRLPFDHVPAEDSGLASDTSFTTVPVDTVDRLELLGKAEGSSTYMALLAAFAVTLWRGSGQRDLVIGSPVAGRDLPDTEHLIGVFINTLPMRVEISPDESFRALLRRVRDGALDDLSHGGIPFESLVEAVRPEREPGRQPLVQVMLQLDNTAFAEPEFPGLEVSYRQLFAEKSGLDLTVSLGRRGTEYGAVWKYRSELLGTSTVRILQERFEATLRELADHPDTPLHALTLLGERERQIVFAERGGMDRDELPVTFLGAFEEWARRTPGRPAVREGDEELDYATLNARTNRLAQRLRALGAGPETLVGLCVERGVEGMVALLAVLKAGAAYVPLDPRQPAARLEVMLQDAPLRFVLAGEAHRASLPDLTVPVHVLGELEAEAVTCSDTDPQPCVSADNLAYVIFTSGSTGRPKGVAITHRGLANYLLHEHLDILNDPDPDRRGSLVGTSLAFDLVLTGLLLPLVAGGCVRLLPEGGELAAYGEALASGESYGLLKVTPSLLDAIDAQLPPEISPDVRLAAVGGEQLTTDLVARWRRRCPDGQVLNHYGPTETVVGCAAYQVPFGPHPDGVVAIGRPMSNTRMYVLDQDGTSLGTGTVGELYIGGACLARGYLGNPRVTAERFVPDPFVPGERLYRTGDLARFRPDGLLEYLGRIDEQVKIRGYRVEPGEVETVLRTHPGVTAAAVVARVRAPGDMGLVAYPVTAPGSGVTAADLHAHLADRLPDYLVPSDIVLLEELPLTGNGKLDRAALPEPGAGDRIRSTGAGTRPQPRPADRTAPLSPVEQAVADVWADVLGLSEVGPHDDFFALGGHSLLAVRLVARIRELFPQLPTDSLLRDLLRKATLAEFTAAMGQSLLAAAMRPAASAATGAGGTAHQDAVPAVDRNQPQPLTPAAAGMWMLERLRPGTAEQVVPLVVELEGPLDPEAMSWALDRLLDRHEALRLRFLERDGVPMALARPVGSVQAPLGRHSAASPQEARRLVDELVARPFDLTTGPLLRGDLIGVGPEHHLLCLTTHHIASDAWSCRIMLRDLAAFYAERAGGAPAALPALTVQLLDHMASQRARLSGGRLEPEVEYWREALANAAELRLPLDRPRPVRRSGAGASLNLRLPHGSAEMLRRLAKDERATPAMVLLTAWQVVLHSAAGGQESVVVGTTVASRGLPETDDLVGFLLNLSVIAGDLSGRPSFREALGRTRETMLQAYAHAEVPFDELIGRLEPARPDSRHPWFQVLFDFDSQDEQSGTMGELTARPVLPEIRTAKYDLALSLRLGPDGLAGELTYDRDVFDESSARGFAGAFEAVLERLAEGSAQDVAVARLASELASRWTGDQGGPAPAAGPATGTATRAPYVEPASETERTLARIWAEHLKTDRVGAEDNFFHLGGHSLLALRAVGRMREVFGVELSVSALFEAPTLRLLAEAVEAAVLAELDAMDEDEVQRSLDALASEEPGAAR